MELQKGERDEGMAMVRGGEEQKEGEGGERTRMREGGRESERA